MTAAVDEWLHLSPEGVDLFFARCHLSPEGVGSCY